jgi:predicted NUDIX family NTP pyrophosphohydrolase
MKTTSCGVLVLDATPQILLCHVTGTAHWDIPKGLRDDGEGESQAAARELDEECGILVPPGMLDDLGRFTYRRGKDLHLFAVLVARIDTRLCFCASTFEDRVGRVRPEMDGFRWAAIDAVTTACAPSMAEVLTVRLSLDALARRLVAAGAPIVPAMRARPA